MTIVYIPSGKSHTFSPTSFGEIISAAAFYNPYEQQQYKRFIFCNMTKEEEQLIRCQLKQDISQEIGVPQSKVLNKHQPEVNEFYLKDIGHIKMR
jgi:hypothetical protein